MTVYHAHVDGFFGTFLSLDALRAWAIVRRQKGCAGKTMSIRQGIRTGNTDYYPANCPTKEIVL